MKQSLLIVDDEAPVRALLMEYFRRRDYEVTVAETAAEAEKAVSQTPFDLIILDVLLPDDDGMFLLSRLQETNPGIRVIIMTGIGFDEELLREAKEKGAVGYISKTLPLDQLLMEVKRALKG
jgi:two-component system response regulator HydG